MGKISAIDPETTNSCFPSWQAARDQDQNH
jgi:hypothetical protein